MIAKLEISGHTRDKGIMRLNCNHNVFCALVWGGLWEQEVLLSPLLEVDYTGVYRLASQQAVVGLLATGLEHATDVRAPKDISMRIMSTVLSLEQRNLAMNTFIYIRRCRLRALRLCW